MAEWLAHAGHDVRVITAPPYYPYWSVQGVYSSWKYSREHINGIKVYRCPLYVPIKPSGLKRLFHLFSFGLSSLPILFWQGIRWRPDIIFVVEPPLICAPAVWIISRMIGAMNWLHIQDFEVDAAVALGLLRLKRLYKIVDWCEAALMRRFDRVSTISDKMLSLLRKKGVKLEKSFKFPNWVDTSLIFPLTGPNSLKKSLNISDQKIVALYSGNMGKKQGLEIIIEAARDLNDYKNIQFVLAGEGSEHATLQHLANGLLNVLFLPLQPLNRLNELLNLADIHLLPQKSDIADLVLPSKLSGMMASGRPVVATGNPGTELAILLKDSGLLVTPGERKGFGEAIIYLAENPEIRREMGNRGRSYAAHHWGHDKVLQTFEKEIMGLKGK
jgi:colanic acid biosynthesis glycosyl transferase WcaI